MNSFWLRQRDPAASQLRTCLAYPSIEQVLQPTPDDPRYPNWPAIEDQLVIYSLIMARYSFLVPVSSLGAIRYSAEAGNLA